LSALPLKRRPRGPRSPWVRLGLFSGALGLFLLGYYWGNQYKQREPPPMEAAILLRPALALPTFTARDADGQPLGPRRFEGHWSLLLVGALNHADTVRGLALQTRVLNRLAAKPELQRSLWPVLISPDPEHDGPQRLSDTVAAYNPNLVAASGPVEEMQPLYKRLGSGPEAPPTLYLIDPQMRATALFTPRQDPATMARDLQRILSDPNAS
jgi:cytochrome oxidase Cu insertion factor (SCO1/SenC/PrrC family)